jgi:hypothetical protein
MESYPEQCAVPGGPTFTRTLTPEEQADLDSQLEEVEENHPNAKYVFDEEKDGEEVPISLINLLAEYTQTTYESCLDAEPPLTEHPTYTIHDIVDGKYVSITGTGCTQSSGGYSLMALVDGEWVSAGGGHTNPSCAKLERYDFPSDIAFSDAGMIERCNDEDGRVVDYPRQ